MGANKIKQKIFEWLPKSVKEQIILNHLSYPSVEEMESSEYTYKIAETEEELLQAFNLIYSEYLHSNLCQEDEEGVRVTKHALLPTTTVLIVKIKDEVIATMTHIQDGPLGLPMEAICDLKTIRDTGQKLAEISTLAIKKGHRRARGKILLPLCKYLYEYSYKYTGTDLLVISTHPNAALFYSSIFGFSPIEKKVKSYGSVNNAPALNQYLNLSYAKEELNIKRRRLNKNPNKSVYKLINEITYKNFIYPDREYYIAYDMSINFEKLEKLSAIAKSQFLKIPESDIALLKNVLYYSEYSKYLGYTKEKNHQNRKEARFWVNCPGVAITAQKNEERQLNAIEASQSRQHGQICTVRAFNVSNSGLLIYSENNFQPQQELTLKLTIGPKVNVKLKANVLRNDKRQFALKITENESPIEWSKFINYLDYHLNPQKLIQKKVA